MALAKAQILGAKDTVVAKVKTPEWGGDGFVYVTGLDGNERDRYDQTQSEKRWPRDAEGRRVEPDWRGLRASLVAMALCDEDGNKEPWTDLEVMQLGKKSGRALDRVFAKIQQLSGLTDDAVEDAEKNSETGPSAGSG